MASIDWFLKARFGMFIHWGVSSLLARDVWVMDEEHIPLEQYTPLARQFRATKFDADRVVSIAKCAGMKHIVFTSKHHDGYCMFDSKLTNFTVKAVRRFLGGALRGRRGCEKGRIAEV